MKKVVIAILVTMIVSSSCRTIDGWMNPEKNKYPSEIAGVCAKARGEAVQKCLNAGYNVNAKNGVKVHLVPGTFKQSGVWCIKRNNQDVGGWATADDVSIVCNPNNHAEIDYGCFVHEWAHQALQDAGYGPEHFSNIKGIKWWR